MPAIDVSFRRNGIQVISGVCTAAIAAVWAYPIQPDTNWLAGIAGGVLGFIAGVLITGSLMALSELLPIVREVRLSPSEYHEMNSRFVAAASTYVVVSLLTVVFLISRTIAGPMHILHLLTWLSYAKAESERKGILCPRCGDLFGMHSPFHSETHRCESCGLIYHEVDIADRQVEQPDPSL